MRRHTNPMITVFTAGLAMTATSVFALPTDMGRSADVYTNAIRFFEARPELLAAPVQPQARPAYFATLVSQDDGAVETAAAETPAQNEYDTDSVTLADAGAAPVVEPAPMEVAATDTAEPSQTEDTSEEVVASVVGEASEEVLAEAVADVIADEGAIVGEVELTDEIAAVVPEAEEPEASEVDVAADVPAEDPVVEQVVADAEAVAPDADTTDVESISDVVEAVLETVPLEEAETEIAAQPVTASVEAPSAPSEPLTVDDANPFVAPAGFAANSAPDAVTPLATPSPDAGDPFESPVNIAEAPAEAIAPVVTEAVQDDAYQDLQKFTYVGSSRLVLSVSPDYFGVPDLAPSTFPTALETASVTVRNALVDAVLASDLPLPAARDIIQEVAVVVDAVPSAEPELSDAESTRDTTGTDDLLSQMADADENLTIRDGGEDGPDTMMMSSDVLFSFGQATLAPEAEATLLSIANMSADLSRIEVFGHTDAIGNEENNLALGQRRAESVRAWLLENTELAPEQIVATGIGESDPVAPNFNEVGQDNPEGRALNRRVEFAIE